jgi:hypothetical protein
MNPQASRILLITLFFLTPGLVALVPSTPHTIAFFNMDIFDDEAIGSTYFEILLKSNDSAVLFMKRSGDFPDHREVLTRDQAEPIFREMADLAGDLVSSQTANILEDEVKSVLRVRIELKGFNESELDATASLNSTEKIAKSLRKKAFIFIEAFNRKKVSEVVTFLNGLPIAK